MIQINDLGQMMGCKMGDSDKAYHCLYLIKYHEADGQSVIKYGNKVGGRAFHEYGIVKVRRTPHTDFEQVRCEKRQNTGVMHCGAQCQVFLNMLYMWNHIQDRHSLVGSE